jgi:hypothetical protein
MPTYEEYYTGDHQNYKGQKSSLETEEYCWRIAENWTGKQENQRNVRSKKAIGEYDDE